MIVFRIGLTEYDLVSWEEIVLSLVTFADTVWIPAHAAFGPKIPDQVSVHIRSTFAALQEAGMLRTWDFEHNVRGSAVPDRVVTTQDHRLAREHIDNRFRRSAPGRNIGDPGVERTSKFIDYRHDLWNILLGDLCGADGFIARSNWPVDFLTNPSAQNQQRYFGQLFRKFQVRHLSVLDVNQIRSLRKYAREMRGQFEGLVKGRLLHVDDVESIFAQDLDERYTEYQNTINDVVSSAFGRKHWLQSLQQVYVNIVGVFLWPVSFLPLFEDSLDSYFAKRRNAFVSYISELKQYTGS
jgi:hypothetical protein